MEKIRKNTTVWEEKGEETDAEEENTQQIFVPPTAVTKVTCPAECNDKGFCDNGRN